MKLPKKNRRDSRFMDEVTDKILPARYLLKDENRNVIETPEEMFQRVARFVAQAEKDRGAENYYTHQFYDMMMEQRFIPNSPTMMNAGTGFRQLSACFVLEPRDDMEDIYDKLKDAAMIMQTGGGVGYTFSHLRPKGHLVSTTKGEASGPVTFMETYDASCGTIKQGGKRRGAQMGILRVDHPDIIRFIMAKRQEGKLSNFNISVAVTDEFLEAVENNTAYACYDPTTDYQEPYTMNKRTVQLLHYDYKYENEGKVEENIWRDYNDVEAIQKFPPVYSIGEPMYLPARAVWELIVDSAWQNGEPGIFNLDETRKQHSFDGELHSEYEINATNPCAEQPLSEYEACNLGHVNVSLMMKEDANVYTSGSVGAYVHDAINKTLLYETVELGVRFLDNVVDQSEFPLEEIDNKVQDMRKIGLGIMGFAQLLFQMGIVYGSEESFIVAGTLMEIIDKHATVTSNNLAREKGCFPAWDKSKYANPCRYDGWFYERTGLDSDNHKYGYKMRNHNVTTIAPTGTTAMIGNTSYGCEPIYAVCNFKNTGNDIREGEDLVEFDDYFLRTLEVNGVDVEHVKEVAIEQMENNEFEGVSGLPIPEELKEVFTVTGDVTPYQHSQMQTAFQRHCDSGISKTINLPNSASRKDVSDAFMSALRPDWGRPSKGITVYRDGSRFEQVLTTRADNKVDTEETVDSEGTSYSKQSIEPDDTCDDCEVPYVKTDGCKMCPECGTELCMI